MVHEEKVNILLVDDRPENLLALEAIIESDRYELFKATSGEEALKYLLKYDFAVILLDVQMPGMDGFSTAKIIKAREKTKDIPILFITANYLDSEHIFMGYSVGAIDYILKPFDPMILKSKVERFVEIYQLKKKLQEQSHILLEKNKVIEHMAYHDILTELPNRRMFNEQLMNKINHAKLTNETFGLLFLDLDRFKNVNDSLGHSIGDKLLYQVGKRLQATVGENDFIARIGGDEFIILLSNADREVALEQAENIIQSFKSPFYIDNFEFYITTCIGLTIFPYDGEDSTTIKKNADTALYRAKEQGKNKYNVFHSGMNINTYRSFLMQTDLRKAIEKDELSLVYQPRVNLRTGKIESAEALLRWNHPQWGIISPNEFIPIAEEIGLIIEIDKWVLKSVCQQIIAWKESNLDPLRISINFSAQHFMQRDLNIYIQNILQDYQIEPTNIEIEITETTILKNEITVKHTLEKIRAMGIFISLDDYGTGYSSMNYLRNFPFDTLKIDKSFVQDLGRNEHNSRVLVESMVTLAQKLNMTVIAEGVETVEQLQLLTEYKCDEVQGYIFSKPLTANAFIHYFENEVTNLKTITSKHQQHVVEPLKKEQIGIQKDIIQFAIKQVKSEFTLSTRETDVFHLIVEGLSNKEISEQLFISEHTVKNHITNILSKLNVTDRVQAIARVYEKCILNENVR